ncbi:alpha/beta hydrolase [Sulfitobacter sp. G21635-S1]|uniref:COG3904 family protein n=1 Tax=Sulfitobacter sp. G21635-S1 TaxID=3014043 RepID=UPI0022AFDC48|nr:alpha/beta hydrolase [Sulfitobacter sp. G21635-S1]MCZ4256514.1 alpha/beta hydrolase [Sulfitobacter sp. G21635-S1]GLT10060.1 hypothetical protein GCM10007928_22920 [Sulfitobacter porphyrae]
MFRRLALILLLALAACATIENASDGTTLRVEGDRLYLAGTITSRTPANFERLLAQNPQVRTLVPTQVSGSVDGAATVRMGYLLRARGIDTHLTPDSVVDSGGVDLFLAGNRRTMARGASLGVHSWRNGYREGSSYPRSAPEHDMTRSYVTDMLGSDAFYWFTLAAAPSDGIHEMTPGEIARYGLLTEPVGN